MIVYYKNKNVWIGVFITLICNIDELNKNTKNNIMGKGKDSKKNVKKAPAKTAKEKKEAKRLKNSK